MNTISYTGYAKVEEFKGPFSDYSTICFYSAGSITFNIPNGSLNIDIILIGGGGGGGRNLGGGGGAGALLGKYGTENKLTVTNGYTITISEVGRGGAGGTVNDDGNGKNGGDTSVIILGQQYTAKGGGGGGRCNTGYPYTGQPGKAGGCGGGGGYTQGIVTPNINLGGATNKNNYSGWISLGSAGAIGNIGNKIYSSSLIAYDSNISGGGGGGGFNNDGNGGILSGYDSNLETSILTDARSAGFVNNGNSKGGNGINLYSSFNSLFGVDGTFGGGGGGSLLKYNNQYGTASYGGGRGGYPELTNISGSGQNAINYTGGGGGGGSGSKDSSAIYSGGNGGHGVVLISGNFKYRLGIPTIGNPISMSKIRNEFDHDLTVNNISLSHYYRNSGKYFTEDSYSYSLIDDITKFPYFNNIPIKDTEPIKFSHFYDTARGITSFSHALYYSTAISQSSLISMYNLSSKKSNEITLYNNETTVFQRIGDSIDIKGNNGTTIIEIQGFSFYYYGTKYFLSNNDDNYQIYFSTDSVLSFGQIFKRFNNWTTSDKAILLGLADRFTYDIKSTNLLVGDRNTVGIRFLTIIDNSNTESGIEANKIKMIISLFRSDRYQYIELSMEQLTSTSGLWDQYTGSGSEPNTIQRLGSVPFYSTFKTLMLRSNLNGSQWVPYPSRKINISLTQIS